MRAVAAAVLLALFAAVCAGGELRLTVEGLPEDAGATAFAGITEGVPAERDGEVLLWAKLDPGVYSVEIVSGGLHVIGVDMRIRDAAGSPVETGEVAGSAREAITDFFEHTESFFETRRMPLVRGTSDRAVALVENIRDGGSTTFGEARGKVVFRLDLWDFEKSYGTWRKTKARAVMRRMVDKNEAESATYLYAPELGGIDVASEETREANFTFPVVKNAQEE